MLEFNKFPPKPGRGVGLGVIVSWDKFKGISLVFLWWELNIGIRKR